LPPSHESTRSWPEPTVGVGALLLDEIEWQFEAL
jgi:hypothetical protein